MAFNSYDFFALSFAIRGLFFPVGLSEKDWCFSVKYMRLKMFSNASSIQRIRKLCL